MPDPKTPSQNANGLISTTSSELPADSEFLRMSLTSTLSSSMSPPPPPKGFGENSRGGGARIAGAVNQNVNQGANNQPSALPERYLKASTGPVTASSNRISNQGIILSIHCLY